MKMENLLFVCGSGRSDTETSSDEMVQEVYKSREEEYVLSGIYGTMVSVDWDSCYADEACIEACPVQVFQWYRTEHDNVPATEMVNATSEGTGSTVKGERKDYTDKSDPIREHDCIWCMACVSVCCPPQAIKVDQSNLEYHEKASGTFN